MKSRVTYSGFSAVMTCVVALLLGYAVFSIDVTDSPVAFFILAIAVILALGTSMWYTPLSVELTDEEIYINRSLSYSKRLPLVDIESVERCRPSIGLVRGRGAVRLCGSGGFLGYWGLFREKNIGTYFAYFGKADECFLVTLKSGRKYVLGCQNPDQMVEAIQEKLEIK